MPIHIPNSITASMCICAMLLSLVPSHVAAQSANICGERTNRELARELRLYRAMLFGKKTAEDAPLNDVRYDVDGTSWIKTAEEGTPWLSPFDQRWSNDTMDAEDEHSRLLPIVGIFETRRVLTSELIPYLLQSIRALDCRLDTVCQTVAASTNKEGMNPVPISSGIQPLGCVLTEAWSYPECHLTESLTGRIEEPLTIQHCDRMANQLLQREAELLKLAVEYDASYRTLLQFAGNFDVFLQEMQHPISGTLRNAAELIAKLQQVPCFLASCDASPPSTTPSER